MVLADSLGILLGFSAEVAKRIRRDRGVGEMVTARIQKVNTVLLMWPSFLKPDKIFIENYTSIVPDITELANYNIGIAEAGHSRAASSCVLG